MSLGCILSSADGVTSARFTITQVLRPCGIWAQFTSTLSTFCSVDVGFHQTSENPSQLINEHIEFLKHDVCHCMEVQQSMTMKCRNTVTSVRLIVALVLRHVELGDQFTFTPAAGKPA